MNRRVITALNQPQFPFLPLKTFFASSMSFEMASVKELLTEIRAKKITVDIDPV